MLDGDNQGTAINQKFQLAPPRTHPPPPQTNLVNTYLICDSPLQRSARRSLVCYTAVLVCEQIRRPIRYDFCGRAKAISGMV